jgi:hypothetical protein
MECFYCEDEILEGDNRYDVGYVTACEDCYNNLNVCSTCNYFSMESENFWYCNSCDESFCTDCSCRCSSLLENRREIREYGWEPEWSFFRDGKNDSCFGIEWECEFKNPTNAYDCIDDLLTLDDKEKYFHLSSDSSLAEERSFEIILQPMGRKTVEEWIKKISKILKSNNFNNGNYNAGIHVNLEPSWFKNRRAKWKFIAILDPFWDILKEICDRGDNSRRHYYRKFLIGKQNLFPESVTWERIPREEWDNLSEIEKIREIYRSNKNAQVGEYHFWIHEKGGRIEIRLLNSTSNPNRIIQWIDFLTCVINYCNYNSWDNIFFASENMKDSGIFNSIENNIYAKELLKQEEKRKEIENKAKNPVLPNITPGDNDSSFLINSQNSPAVFWDNRSHNSAELVSI